MKLIQSIVLAGIQFYRRWLSPLNKILFGPSAGCRFEPTCSVYAYEAIRLHGIFRGGWLLGRRLCRCHPWGGAGWDPVQEDSVSMTRPSRLDAGGMSPSDPALHRAMAHGPVIVKHS
jgi:putative membrane protein insertion efficiency factor